jgi:hypothetical protein
MTFTDEEIARAKEVRVEIMQSETPEGDCEVIAIALLRAEAKGMERAAKICHALNLTLEYTGQPLQDCISNRIRSEAAKLRGEST